jgi:hypothetical protein
MSLPTQAVELKGRKWSWVSREGYRVLLIKPQAPFFYIPIGLTQSDPF